MKKNISKRAFAIALCVCMVGPQNLAAIGGLQRVSAEVISQETLVDQELTQAGTRYEVDFTDSTKRGGFRKVTTAGTLTFTDGAGSVGFMTVGADGHTVVQANDAPALADGYLESDVTMVTGTKFTLGARVQDNGNMAGIGYDNGSWFWMTATDGSKWGNISAAKTLETGKTYRLRMEYEGTRFIVKVAPVATDGTIGAFEQVLDTTIADLPTAAGKPGFRMWGSGSSIKVDNMVSGTFQKVAVTPARTSLSWAEAGTNDVTLTLNTDGNALTKVFAGQTQLTNTDYTSAVNGTSTTVTIKAAYLLGLKNAQKYSTNLSFEFADGYVATHQISIAQDPNRVFVHKSINFDSQAKIDAMTKTGNGTVAFVGGKLDITNGQGVMLVDNSAEISKIKNAQVEFDCNTKTDGGQWGVVLRYKDANNWIMIGPNGGGNQKSDWYIRTSSGLNQKLIGDGNRIFANRFKPYKIGVRLVDDVITLFKDDEEIYSGVVNGLSSEAGGIGMRFAGGAGGSISNLTIKEVDALVTEPTQGTPQVISTNQLEAKLDKDFPRVIEYTLKSTGAKTTGQVNPNHYVEINNVAYRPKITSTFTATKGTYHFTIDELNVEFDVIMEVKGNTLDFRIKNIKDTNHTIHTFNFPEQSLVSISSTKTNAELRANNYQDGEKTIKVASANTASTYSNASIVVLSGSDIAASLHCGSIKSRREISYQIIQAEDGTKSAAIWPNEFIYKGLDDEIIEEPWAVVSITGDRNKDSVVDFQDAAIARRDDCYKHEEHKQRFGTEMMANGYSMIAMNVGSAAQYPFLRILDNVKKFYLGTDGFQQNILIKGYQSEGHDAAHPDFANYSKRAGGLSEFKTLLNEAEKYNANIGVHINHTEAYPEAKQYADIVANQLGWEWYDTSKMIKRENDINDKTNGMAARLQQLDKDTEQKLKWIYVDVYFDTRWPMYKLANEITKNMNGGKGIPLATENTYDFTKDAVWGHALYGAFNSAGNLVRFVNNQEQDIFYNSNIFRGLSGRNNGIMGWQNSYNYTTTIEEFFTKVLPNRFLAQYPIMQYKTNDKVVLGDNNQVESKMVNNVNVITLNGKEIANGNKIFIPWTIKGEEKIYHWNPTAGSSTWDLPEGWTNLANVKVFELSDEGRKEPVVVTVTNGKVTINAKAKTGYSIYKGTEAVQRTDITTFKWGEGGFVKDAGFDSHTLGYAWTKQTGTNNVVFENTNYTNTQLVMKDAAGSVTQEITGLVPGKTYSASAWIFASEGSVGTIGIKPANGEKISNYIDQCDVVYGINHTDKNGKYAQRVKVSFVQPAGSTTATLSLEATQNKAGNKVTFDDVRLMEIPAINKQGHYVVEDFESVDQGYGVFVSPESDHSHLSETNPGVTDDTITGQYSFKIRTGDYFRTMPHTVRFKPNTKYTVSMDYKTISNNAFTFAAKYKEGTTVKTLDTKAITNNGTGTVTLSFTTGNYKDCYLDITKNSGNQYVVDNLIIDEVVTADKTMLQTLYNSSVALVETDYTVDSFAALTTKKNEAKVILDKAAPSQTELDTAYAALNTAKNALVAAANTTDLASLQSAIEGIEGLDENAYVKDAAYTALQTALNEAKALKGQTRPSKTAVTAMITNLETKKNALTKVSTNHKTELTNAIVEFEAIDLTGYESGPAMEVFKSALAEAKELANKANVTEEEVRQAIEAVNNAKKDLIPVVIQDEKNDWVTEDGQTHFYIRGEMQKNFWVEGGDKKRSYVDEAGNKVFKWKQIEKVWYYFGAEGYAVTGWKSIDGSWYYFKALGEMKTGWLKDGGAWYYLQSSGKMKTGWLKENGVWYYLQSSGKMKTGWLKENGVWYYLQSSGKMKTGWLKDGGAWYYLQSSGKMKTGWLKDGASWYYLQSSGKMKTGWLKLGTSWYYLKASGIMATGWTFDGQKTYYFNTTSGIWDGRVQ